MEDSPNKEPIIRKTFEDFIPELEILLNKRRHKWTLVGIQWMDFDDVKQQIMVHIFRKFEQFDQTQPFSPWAATIVSNQMKNMQRNLYYSCARPCVQNCAFNEGSDSCGYTKSGKQDSSCPLFKKWELKKKSAYDLRLPLPQCNHENEVFEMPTSETNLEKGIENFHKKMLEVLKPIEKRIYDLLFVQKLSEEDAAKAMNYTTNERGRSAGYNNFIRAKKKIIEKAKKIVKDIDFT